MVKHTQTVRWCLLALKVLSLNMRKFALKKIRGVEVDYGKLYRYYKNKHGELFKTGMVEDQILVFCRYA